MSISATDLIWYGSANMPEADTGTGGGAIDTTVKVTFTDITPSGTVEALSSSASDTTQTLTISGLNVAGEAISEGHTLNGTNVVTFTSTFERILKAVLSGTTVGTITIRKTGAGGDLITLAPGLTSCRSIFINAVTPVSGTTYYYEKVFVKNTHGTLSLTSSVITENADPSGLVEFGLAATLDDTVTIANRLTAPGGISFDSAAKNVANSQNLTAASAQGVWLKLTLAYTEVATKTSYTSRITGNTI